MIDEDTLLESGTEEPAFSFATVSAVSADGISLTLDGQSESGGKKYLVNACALFKAGDRVRIHQDGGSIVVEFPVGEPGSRYPLPAGGAKDQVLVKGSAADYDVKWADGGGSDAHGIPSGGSTGQMLRKKSATDYDTEWATPSVAKLQYSSAVGVEINSAGVVQSINNTQPSLGSSTYGKQWKDIYTSGGTLSLGASKLGFFGTTPVSRQSLSSSATLAQLIQALKNYGLFS